MPASSIVAMRWSGSSSFSINPALASSVGATFTVMSRYACVAGAVNASSRAIFLVMVPPRLLGCPVDSASCRLRRPQVLGKRGVEVHRLSLARSATDTSAQAPKASTAPIP